VTDQAARRVLHVVACGGRPAGDLPAFVAEAQQAGWEVGVIATPSALKFTDLPRLTELTGHQVRHDYKQPDEPDPLPPPGRDHRGAGDLQHDQQVRRRASATPRLGLLNDAVGLGLPVIAVPFPNIALAQHPAFQRNLRELRASGVRLLLDPDAHPLPTPNLGPASRDLFPWEALSEELHKLTASLSEESPAEHP